ncbi:MAG: acyl-CoA synthetase [Pseudomonadales bacterium]|jgi:fatty-acyl-CoA synthase|nr:acyl-CoA synthetase [Pseudomonadales bacterium]
MSFNLAAVSERIAEVVPDREALVFRNRRLTYGELRDRTRRLANHLIGAGLGCHRERRELAGHESGQDHLALYLHNGNEYLEGMLGAYKARVAPFNVNYRYVEEELVYLLNDAKARAIVYHDCFAPRVAAVRDQVPTLEVFLQVADESGEALLDGAVRYEDALAAASAERPDVEWSPDDLYILYTGGTTGMPKGVLWRQADILVAALGGRDAATGEVFDSLDRFAERAEAGALGGGIPMRVLPSPPFMHGAGHWIALGAWHAGNTVLIQDEPERFHAPDVCRVAERERANLLLIVGDAFGKPLIEALRAGSYDLAALQIILSGGAALNASYKQELLELLPHVTIMDSIGSSEAGGQGSTVSNADTGASTGRFLPGPGSVVVSEDFTRLLEPGHEGMGWWAKQGQVPLGYLGDPAKTAKTFPVIDGVRYSVPGDRARLLADGTIELHGRDSQTINSGGEKIFAEEVEHALKQHPSIWDAVVAGRPSERWGQEVVAIVQLADGARFDEASVLAECEKHLARYKLPKAFVVVDRVLRSPAGKADYRWAKEQAATAG